MFLSHGTVTMFLPLGYYAFSGIFNFATTLGLSILVLVKNPKSHINRKCAVFFFSVAVWSFFYFIWLMTPQKEQAEFYMRTCMIAVLFMPSLIIHFVDSFLKLQRPRAFYVVNYSLSVLFTLAVYTPLYATGVSRHLVFPYWLIPGPVFHVALAHFSAIVGYSFYLLHHAFRRAQGIAKGQILYVYAGTLVGFISGSTNYLCWYRVPIPPFLNIFVSLYVFLIAYGIVRYRLMDITVAVTRTGILIGVYALVLIIPAVLATVFRSSLTAILGPRWWLVPQGVFAALALAGPFVYFFFQRRAEANILYEQRRYQATLMNAAKGMVRIRDLKRLLRLIAYLLTRSMKLAHAEIFLWDQKASQYVLPTYRLKGGKEQPAVVLPLQDPLIHWLQTHRTVVVSEELGARSDGVSRQETLQRLRQLHAAVIVPNFINERLIGFVVLGGKRNGRMFSQDDLNVLQTLASQAALAIENARFFGELQSTQAQLFQSEKMAALGHMGAGLSHQLHNRFMALLKNSGVLLHIELPKMLAQANWTPEQRQQLQKFVDNLQGIEREAGRGAEIVNKLIKYARLSPDNQLVDLHEVIKEAIGMLQFTAKLDTIDLVYDLPESVPKIRGNFTYLQDVFFNLTDNAYQAIDEKQRRMATRVLPDQPDYKGVIAITARHLEAERKVKITVHDNGVGMSKEELAQLFTPFFTTKSSSGHGTGMGLFIIKKMIEEAHRGTIEVASTYGIGTSFIVHLPAAKE